jgi:hypothetical protein
MTGLTLHYQTPKPLEETPDRIHLQTVRRPHTRGPAVIGTENQAGSVDEQPVARHLLAIPESIGWCVDAHKKVLLSPR